MDEQLLLKRITVDSKIFGGKPIIRGRRLAVEHILGMLAAGDTIDNILEGYPWLKNEDIQACLIHARRLVGHERIEVLPSVCKKILDKYGEELYPGSIITVDANRVRIRSSKI